MTIATGQSETPEEVKRHCNVQSCSAYKDPHPITGNVQGQAEVWGPLVQQPAEAARLARILHHAAQELWDACTGCQTDAMRTEARAIARRILAGCHD